MSQDEIWSSEAVVTPDELFVVEGSRGTAENRRAYVWQFFRSETNREIESIFWPLVSQSRAKEGASVDLVARLIDEQKIGQRESQETGCVMTARREYGLKLTNGFVIIEQDDLRGLNIGSLCFNEIVK
ncbi:hypothetical protein B0G81_2220 [Paraburkholderia sp. BL6665CI2N2]|uniref:hypothetical protein n=1 Tax=Paraburkholderia sp. BL6665CI2N2 TaxID=1938806 RepID=UPI001066FD2C|nr:hypothetical protein [Paraburkholderia sp. BL6665CI2N2]TDY21973.1 hypothetical protein B0G81_2220 [Paraburkholderia sp. BL6665CI2N2]